MRDRLATVEETNVVKAKEATLEEVVAQHIFTVDPPIKI